MEHFPGLRTALLILGALAPTLAAQNVPKGEHAPSGAANLTAQELEEQGDTLRGQKDYLGAIDCYRAAWKKADSPMLHNKAGISYSQLHRIRDAKREYEQSIHLDRDYAEPHNNLGALYYSAQRFGPAVKEYQRAIRLSPDNAVFHNNLGAAYFSEKDFTRAMKEFTRAVELDPTIFERQASGGSSVKLVSSDQRGHFHYLMAQMYGSQNDVEHCRYYLAKANEEGYPIRDALRDGEFAGLRKDPNFITFVRSLKPPAQENQ
jgi:tetratricopeptide (TPR) repeat protein